MGTKQEAMAAGGRNPQKSAVARARAQSRADQEGAGGGGSAGAKGRQFDQSAADDAAAKRDHTKALRAEREKIAKVQEEKEARQAAKVKKAEDEKAKSMGLDKKASFDKKNITTAVEAAPAEEDCLADAFEGLDLGEKYGHDWSMTEVQNDKITKKQVVDYMDANSSDEFKAANGLPVSKSGLKKSTKDTFVQVYAKMLKECPK